MSLYRCYLNVEQECIPVGCVPAAHWPSQGGGLVHPRRKKKKKKFGAPQKIGDPLKNWRPPKKLETPQKIGDPPGQTPPPGPDHPPPTVNRILDTRLWKYYLGPTSLRPLIRLCVIIYVDDMCLCRLWFGHMIYVFVQTKCIHAGDMFCVLRKIRVDDWYFMQISDVFFADDLFTCNKNPGPAEGTGR